MGRTTAAMVLAGCLLAIPSGNASAQSAFDRDYYVTLGGGGQSGSTTFADETTFREYDEDGRIIFTGSVGSISFFDISAGRRFKGRWTAGLGFHKGSKTGDGILVIGAPHPLFFGRARDTSLAIGGLRRDEHATHLQIGYLWDLAERLQLHVTGGPSFFRVKQVVVVDATFQEVGPPFTAIVATPNVATRSKNSVGANLGADVAYRFYDRDRVSLGAGLFLRYTGASAEIGILNSEVASSPGGFQYGLNLRAGF